MTVLGIQTYHYNESEIVDEQCRIGIVEVKGCIALRKSWYLLPVLLLCIGSGTHAYAQGGCSIVNSKVNYPSPVYVGQPFTITVTVTVWCSIQSYIRSDITASLGSSLAESMLTDKNSTVAQSGSYLNQLTLTAAGNWSLDGAILIMDFYNNQLASSNYHYNINVLPAGSVTTQTLSTSETVNESTTTVTQTLSSTVTLTTSLTVTVETPTPTTVTSMITTTNESIFNDTTYSSLVIVLVILFVAALIGLIVRRRTE